MATFDYRCPSCGSFEIRSPVGRAQASAECPRCGATASRVFSAPALLSGDTPLSRAVEADRRSAHEPAVVAAPPAARPRAALPRRSSNPLHAKLPRP